jgi:glycine/D-amino acid oxidase-like deaminating enzyme
LKVNGTFHFDEGYYYLRNVGERILFGGARNLDIKGETTTGFGTTDTIQNNLLKHLQETILPNTPFEIEHTWSGIMGVGDDKKPIIKTVTKNIYCSVRMGGMGVAIGSLAGIKVANLALED